MRQQADFQQAIVDKLRYVRWMFLLTIHRIICAHTLKHVLKWWQDWGLSSPPRHRHFDARTNRNRQQGQHSEREINVEKSKQKALRKAFVWVSATWFQTCSEASSTLASDTAWTVLLSYVLFPQKFFLCTKAKFGSWIQIRSSPWRDRTSSPDPRVTDAISVSHNSHKVCHKQSECWSKSLPLWWGEY